MLGELDAGCHVGELLANKNDGRIKLFVTSRALRVGREHPGLFSAGEYVPLEVTGAKSDHVFAFMRRKDGVSAVSIVPRLMTKLSATGLPLGDIWDDTAVQIPELAATTTWKSVLTDAMLSGTSLLLKEVLKEAPVALLLASSD